MNIEPPNNTKSNIGKYDIPVYIKKEASLIIHSISTSFLLELF
jgi:hypothetical protein